VSKFTKYPSLLLATGFGIGFLPGAPGTYGSVLAVGFYPFLPRSNLAYLVFLLIAIPIGCFAAAKAEKYFQKKDPSQVVIDEILGMWLAMWTLRPSILNLILAFFFFRLFDILKPFPVRQLEKVPGGIGIVLDDLMAGAYALLVMRLLQFWFLHP